MSGALNRVKGVIFSRAAVAGLFLLAQIALFMVFVLRLSRYFAAMYGVFVLISALVGLHIINGRLNPSYKIAWLVPVLIFPLFGGLFYLVYGSSHLSRVLSRRITSEEKGSGLASCRSAEAETLLSKLPEAVQNQSRYIQSAGYPAFAGTAARYLPSGEAMLESLLQDLKAARHCIYMEYFIIGRGKMWDSILAVLEEKAAAGLDVRVIYDGFGCINTLPGDYYKTLREKGIRCIEFNPLLPVLTRLMNNRDHRKITVIDGGIGYMGGVNLADEYINAVDRFGHWKDCAVRLQGEAVRSLSAMFCSMWNALGGERCEPPTPEQEPRQTEGSGVIQPYSDSPLDDEQVGEGIYLGMISRAQRYIYICTPYFIVDNETLTVLRLAAKSGVDVRIVTPRNGDKWYVHRVTRSYYPQLIESGVRIYEYTPGFIHSKLFVSDDTVATVGTVNLDYRSLYLHFECGVWMAGAGAVADIKADFLKTLESCERITEQSPLFKTSGMTRLVNAVIRMFAPLM